MNILSGEGLEDPDDEGVNKEGVDNSLSSPLSESTLNFGSSPFNGDIDLELLSIGEKKSNLKGGGENAALVTFWMLPVGVLGGVRLKAAGEG
jgi:hypothetical protein